MNLRIFVTLISVSLILSLSAQEKQYKIGTVAFYNLENLFDTIDTPDVQDTEFTPAAEKNYDTEKYQHKLEYLSRVISKVGTDLAKIPPAVLGVSEVENKSVLVDLVAHENLEKYNYGVVHRDGPDERGVDCGLLYRKNAFKPVNVASYPVHFKESQDDKTRDQLLVSGLFDGEMMHFIVIHYSSRRGGQKASNPKRVQAARVSRQIVDSILQLDSNAKIFVLGDFNDDPVNESVDDVLNASGSKKLKKGEMFNPMYALYKDGVGSLAYKDKWNLFDMVIMSPALLEKDMSSYRFYKAYIFNKEFLMQKEGRFKGYPFRTFVGSTFLGGYSDHFPAYVYLIKEVK